MSHVHAFLWHLPKSRLKGKGLLALDAVALSPGSTDFLIRFIYSAFKLTSLVCMVGKTAPGAVERLSELITHVMFL